MYRRLCVVVMALAISGISFAQPLNVPGPPGPPYYDPPTPDLHPPLPDAPRPTDAEGCVIGGVFKHGPYAFTVVVDNRGKLPVVDLSPFEGMKLKITGGLFIGDYFYLRSIEIIGKDC